MNNQNKLIVYQNPATDSIEFLIPCIDNIEFIINKDIPKNNGNIVPYKIVSEIPKYFESYNLINNEIIQCKNKLYNLKKEEWRRIRKPILEKLDIEFMRALEQNDIEKISEIKNKKKELRDITLINIENISSQELEELIPDILKN